MRDYFLRRFLLVIPTLLGVTFMVFFITRCAPGGPIEHQLQAMQKEGDGGGGGGQQGSQMNEEEIEALEEEYGYDRGTIPAYLTWLGALPRERRISKEEFKELGSGKIGASVIEDHENEALLTLKGSGRQVKVTRKGTDVVSAVYVDELDRSISEDGWNTRIETVVERQERWARRNREDDLSKAPDNYDDRAIVFRKEYAGLLQGDLGRSTRYGDPVLSMIWSRIPVALYFGILTALITYGISLPLGIVKALRHRTAVDTSSSILIFIGYSIPGFALGAILLVYLGARQQWFPMFGLTSPDFASLSLFGKLKDLLHHTWLPLLSYVVTGFALLTMMMKNNLMDNLATDYVRTAVAKGASFKRAVFKHAFRNSIIPIASTIGQLVTIFVGGSLLIEKVFDIQGFGLLMLQAIVGRDFPVVMGVLTVSALLLMIGNIISDFVVALIDPRVKFT